MNVDKKNAKCKHCYDQKYVFVYWFERVLDQNGVHMTDIPSDIFKQIPVDLITQCHCNIALLLPSNINRGPFRCHDCEGITWRFTETAEQEGYRWKKVVNLAPRDLKELPCEFFERCPCGYDDQAPKSPEKRKKAKEAFDLLKIRIPRFGFGFSFAQNIERALTV